MELTPKQIVEELSRYIIGQDDAKKAVAIALRNRYRRRQLQPEIGEEITPKNIIMKGPTGVGKTEIARRLARLVKAPFVKVEATKFTEVGYVGRDVESMVRDLVEVAVRLVREEKINEVEPKAKATAEKKIINALYPIRKKANPEKPDNVLREELYEQLRKGQLDKIPVEIEIEEAPKTLQIGPIGGGPGGMGIGEGNIGDIFGSLMPRRRKKRKINVGEALKIFINEEANKLIDKDAIQAEALQRAEQSGIIFIDEIDKISSRGGASRGPEVSREGVQRDILPIVEGCTIATKYGNIKTDYILFIAAGAFHISKVSDLIPELQGRFPVIVELQSLTQEDFIKILQEPDNAIIKQYSELLAVDKINLKFTDEAIDELSRIAFLENENNENIGARRLHNVMEKVLEEVSFDADGSKEIDLIVDSKFVQTNMEKTLKTLNLKKYVL